jgi:hypothetical protein
MKVHFWDTTVKLCIFSNSFEKTLGLGNMNAVVWIHTSAAALVCIFGQYLS